MARCLLVAKEDQGLHTESESPPILTGHWPITGRQMRALTGEEDKESDRRERTREQKRKNKNRALGRTQTYLLVIMQQKQKCYSPKEKRHNLKRKEQTYLSLSVGGDKIK